MLRAESSVACVHAARRKSHLHLNPVAAPTFSHGIFPAESPLTPARFQLDVLQAPTFYNLAIFYRPYSNCLHVACLWLWPLEAGDQAEYIVAWSTQLAMYPRIWKWDAISTCLLLIKATEGNGSSAYLCVGSFPSVAPSLVYSTRAVSLPNYCA